MFLIFFRWNFWKKERIRSWIQLQSKTFAEIIIFNRKIEGQVSRIRIGEYLIQKDFTEEWDFAASFNAIEKKLPKLLTRIQIEGKGGQTVPVLLTPSFKKSIHLLCNGVITLVSLKKMSTYLQDAIMQLNIIVKDLHVCDNFLEIIRKQIPAC